MFVQSIDVDGVPVTQGEVVHVDEDGIIGDFEVQSIGLYPNGRGGDLEVRVEVAVPTIKHGVEVGAIYVEVNLESCSEVK